ncbi:hypothetical protein [Methylococcus sp. Mc7]|uniref:hypothetical protein n=1 Tax=Methylococcus sp. Mc7 TaxID=2860258 RepID=UPI001C533BBD|nr:hypothetical protein [Methylococcus sp. Mc7]QXP83021.1 hypothetical protein KW115_12530 [Methylococcus sp. Mc7]
MVDNTPSQNQGNTPFISIQDADQLDREVFDLADRLEMLAILCRELVVYYPDVRDLKAIERSVKSAIAELGKAKSPVRGLWNVATEADEMEGRGNV